MLNAATLLLLALGASAQPSHKAPTAADIAIDQVEVIMDMDAMAQGDVEVSVVWTPCGMENASYSYGSATITLCLEMDDTPAALFAAAHEMGHAIVDQMDLAVDDDPWANERAADEIAALALLKTDRADAVIGGAKWFMEDASWDWNPFDEHPPSGIRARELLCLADGASAHPANTGCLVLYRALSVRWQAAVDK